MTVLNNIDTLDDQILLALSKPYMHERAEAIQALLNKSVLEALNKLEKRIEYNQHDMGEMGKFIRVQYCKNFIEELRQITEQENK